MLQTTVMRMAELIDNVLDFARGRLGGGITLDRDARKPLEPVLHQIIDELRLSSPGRQIEAEYAIDSPVDCDRARIGQLVSNLVGNALSHGASNQPVRVRAETVDGLSNCQSPMAANPYPSRDGKAVRTVLPGRSARQSAGPGARIAHCLANRESARRCADRDLDARGNRVYLRDATSMTAST